MVKEECEATGDAYQQAQADAKAAAARVKALRPWYRKKRYIFGIPLAAVVLLAIIGSLTVETDGEAAPSLTGGQPVQTRQASQATAERPAGMGDLVRVGSLDLTVLSVDTAFNSKQYNQFNDANVGVQIKATNARGDTDEEYNVNSFFAMKLVDSNGIAHDPVLGCAGCPDEITSVDLVRGGSVTGWVYFEIPAGRRVVEFLYAPLFSANKARISLR